MKTLRRIGRFLLAVPVLLAVALGIGIALDKMTVDTQRLLYPRKYAALVSLYAEKWELPESMVYAVIKTESNFDEAAVSHAGAVGLMQLTADTYEWLYFLRGEDADTDSMAIPSYNIDAGCQLLAWLYDKFHNWDTVCAAYNAGYARVCGWLTDETVSENGVLVHIPINETDAYVRAVAEAEAIYRSLYYETTEAIT